MAAFLLLKNEGDNRMSTCTAPDCENPTDLYLCGVCVSDLQQWLAKVKPLRAELFTTMAKLDQTAPTKSEGGGGISTGSAMPLRAGALEARQHLSVWEGRDAADLAHEEFSGEYINAVRKLIAVAEKIIDNPEEQFTFGICGAETGVGPCGATITAAPEAVWTNCHACEAPHNVRERTEALRAKAKGEPLSPREVRDYLRTNAGISIKTKDFENWVYHRHLAYVLDRVGIGTEREAGRRIYFPGEVFRVYRTMLERKSAA